MNPAQSCSFRQRLVLARRFIPERFTLLLICTVTLAAFLPAQGAALKGFSEATVIAIALLFFMHGAKLSREAVISGASNWRLHLMVVLLTFVLFPLLGLVLKPALMPLITPDLYVGILYLCTLPSTVQSSIAFTSVAHGNVPAAVCSASASNLLGIFITPLLVGTIVISTHGQGVSFDAVLKIVEQLLVPFVAGQIVRRWIGGWVARHAKLLKAIDQGSILLVVYVAFSEATEEGLWHQLPPRTFLLLLIVVLVLLAVMLFITTYTARKLHFSKEDEITIVFCGSKKSLASGVPMAKVLFSSHTVGMVVLPIMLFHQVQLMACAVLARRYAKRIEQPDSDTDSVKASA